MLRELTNLNENSKNLQNNLQTHPLIKGKVILVNKPYTWTSFNVVSKIRWWVRQQTGVKKVKVGHAGTLDPLASGLLIVCTGKFTKRINEFQEKEKEYSGSFTLGAITKSYDLESEVEPYGSLEDITEEKIIEAARHFTGTIMQIPPTFSAVKVNGKRAYEYARGDEEVIISAKPITIYAFEITKIELPLVYFNIICSKGTYIRSIARDFGEYLKCGAYLSSLVRERIGEFSLKEAIDLRDLQELK